MNKHYTRAIQADLDDTDPAFFASDWGAHRPNLLQAILIGMTRRSFLRRGRLRQMMTKLIVSLKCPIDITFRSCRYRIGGRNNLIEYGLLARPEYNGQEIDFLAEALNKDGVFLDIGCNIGLYSIPLAQAAGPKGRVLAIDANKTMIQHLEFNARASGITTITGLNLAVGAETGRVGLAIRCDDVAIVNVVQQDDGPVEMRPLETIVKEAGLSQVDALKIDIEGHEDIALVPYLQNVDDALLPSRIVIERMGADGDYPGCAAEFERLGYELQGKTRNNALYLRK